MHPRLAVEEYRLRQFPVGKRPTATQKSPNKKFRLLKNTLPLGIFTPARCYLNYNEISKLEQSSIFLPFHAFTHRIGKLRDGKSN